MGDPETREHLVQNAFDQLQLCYRGPGPLNARPGLGSVWVCAYRPLMPTTRVSVRAIMRTSSSNDRCLT